MNLIKKISYLLAITIISSACSSDDDAGNVIDDTPQGDFDNGILVTNEGPFGTGTGTVSFITEDLSTVEEQIFQTVNGSDLGNIVQSLGFYEDQAYIVANNSSKITVVNRYTFEEIAVIENDLENPRYFLTVGDTGYVTNWGDPFDNSDDYVAVIDLETQTVSSTIPVSFGPERLVANGDKLYVAHSGGFDYNNVVSLIDTNSNTVDTTITVGDVPNSVVLDGVNLWVLCGGKPAFTGNESNGSMYQINTATDIVSQSFDFGATDHPSNLVFDASDLYYGLNGEVYQMKTIASGLPTSSVLSGSYYSLTANDGKLYATDAADFQSSGTLKVFDLLDFSEITSLEMGIIPGGVYFNN